MDSTSFEGRQLEIKKVKVREVVERLCAMEGLPLPSINFNGCPSESDNDLAHYHPSENRICISPRQLNALGSADLERVIIHEVTHILEHGHGPGFRRKNGEFVHKMWRPPSTGVSYVSGGEDTAVPGKRQRPERAVRSKSVCNQPGCAKRAGLRQCDYCGRYFCQEHSGQLISTTLNYMQRLGQGDYGKWKKYNGDWNRKDGHPCPKYTIWWNEEGRHLEEGKDAAGGKGPENSLSSQKQEDIIRKVYENYDSSFGSEGRYAGSSPAEEHPPKEADVAKQEPEKAAEGEGTGGKQERKKKPGLLERLKDALGFE